MTHSITSQMSPYFVSLVRELGSESDRGGVVLAVAWIEDQLTLLLKAFLCAQPNNKPDNLLKVGGPLGDFGVKIELAYRLGLLREPIYRSLNLFRRLRNDFAHLSSKLTLDTPSVKDRVSEVFNINRPTLDVIWGVVSEIEEAKLLLGSSISTIPSVEALSCSLGPRVMLHLTAATTACNLMYAISKVEQRKVLV